MKPGRLPTFLLPTQSVIAAILYTRSLRLRKGKGLPKVTQLGNRVLSLRAWGLSLHPASVSSEDPFLKPVLDATVLQPPQLWARITEE